MVTTREEPSWMSVVRDERGTACPVNGAGPQRPRYKNRNKQQTRNYRSDPPPAQNTALSGCYATIEPIAGNNANSHLVYTGLADISTIFSFFSRHSIGPRQTTPLRVQQRISRSQGVAARAGGAGGAHEKPIDWPTA